MILQNPALSQIVEERLLAFRLVAGRPALILVSLISIGTGHSIV